MSVDRRAAEEAYRLALEQELRPGGASAADRDHGLEAAWVRRLAGTRLADGDASLSLRADGSYRARFAERPERGTWSITSCVGRASLMLRPRGGAVYGYILTHDGGGVALNGRPHAAE